jgi:hypothetical protein
MTTCKIHFVNGKVLEIEGYDERELRDNLILAYDRFGDTYRINVDKVLYLLIEEVE